MKIFGIIMLKLLMIIIILIGGNIVIAKESDTYQHFRNYFADNASAESSDNKESSVFGLTIRLNSEKNIYMPGEPIVLTLSVENRTSSPILIHKAFEVSYGWIYQEIATEEEGIYRTCACQGFGMEDAIVPLTPMKPGEKLSVSYKILFNYVSGRNPKELQTNYIFCRPGIYFLRTGLSHIIPEQCIHTAPISIEIKEPTGPDAIVWNLLQTEDAAYFLHTGSPLGYDNSIAEDFGQITARYPDSFYAPYLRRSLDEFGTQELRHAKKSSRPAKAEIIDIGGQPLMVRTFPDTRKRSGSSYTNKDIEEIAKLTELRTKAYNANDPPGMIRYMSRSKKGGMRQTWEHYSEWGRKDLAETFREAFAKRGSASVRLVRVTFKEDGMAEADLVISYEKAPHENPFQKTTYILDDDGVWRIGTLELEW